MASIDFEKLVSQAEDEGVTLAEMISRTLTPGQIDDLQSRLCVELVSGYNRIEGFMSEVRVPSLDEIMESGSISETDAAVCGDEAGT